MTDMNEKTPEYHECKRQLRLQKQHEQRGARLASETKEQRERRLQLQRTARKRREQSRLAEQTSEEAQKRLKAERQRDASRLQCQTAEQTARRQLDQSEAGVPVNMFPPKCAPPGTYFLGNVFPPGNTFPRCFPHRKSVPPVNINYSDGKSLSHCRRFASFCACSTTRVLQTKNKKITN